MKAFKTIDLGIIKSLTITTRISYKGFNFTLDKKGRLRLIDDVYHREIRDNLIRFRAGEFKKYTRVKEKVINRVKAFISNRDFSNLEVENVKEVLPELLKIQALINEMINKAQKE